MKKKHGGARKGAGRKRKADEINLAEKMQSILNDEELLGILADNVRGGDQRAIELWAGYRFGKPTQRVEKAEVKEIPQTVFVDATSED